MIFSFKKINFLVLILVIFNLTVSSVFAEVCQKGPPDELGGLPEELKLSCFVDGTTLIIKGPIRTEILDTLKANKITHIILNTPGGSVSTALAIANWIRKNNITTEIPQYGHCFSTCTLVFQAGIHRIASVKSRFLYHCFGLGPFGAAIMRQNCGEDPNTYSEQCKKDLEDITQISLDETSKFYKNLEMYGAIGIQKAFMEADYSTNWFESGNFCKKRMLLEAPETIKFSVVQELIPLF